MLGLVKGPRVQQKPRFSRSNREAGESSLSVSPLSTTTPHSYPSPSISPLAEPKPSVWHFLVILAVVSAFVVQISSGLSAIHGVPSASSQPRLVAEPFCFFTAGGVCSAGPWRPLEEPGAPRRER